ncbi:MAG: hypothetical protein PHQ66_01590 [Candidatus Nanoarchaeia archaeon]|nr:hypothetical protein [Candidatus Nanoarchaeia archaeon]MDD5357931.1 hypothetical protein [Candidatus Nanoarchaeia archaeon]MDD5588850.1 hypothetical protein [Candidatus Nanoarchaeia archaeon]
MYTYEDIKRTLASIECPESYMSKGLNELGYESFPESGLNDKGQSKLLRTVLDIYNSEMNLSLRNYKTKIIKKDGKTIIKKEKIKRPEKKPKSLEMLVFKEDLQKIGDRIKTIAEYTPEVVRGVLKMITYPTIGVNLLFPTMFRKAINFDNGDTPFYGEYVTRGWTISGTIIGSAGVYTTLALTKPEYILPVALTQIGANIASGLYEWGRSIRERAKEKRKEIEKKNKKH